MFLKKKEELKEDKIKRLKNSISNLKDKLDVESKFQHKVWLDSSSDNSDLGILYRTYLNIRHMLENGVSVYWKETSAYYVCHKEGYDEEVYTIYGDKKENEKINLIHYNNLDNGSLILTISKTEESLEIIKETEYMVRYEPNEWKKESISKIHRYFLTNDEKELLKECNDVLKKEGLV